MYHTIESKCPKCDHIEENEFREDEDSFVDCEDCQHCYLACDNPA